MDSTDFIDVTTYVGTYFHSTEIKPVYDGVDTLPKVRQLRHGLPSTPWLYIWSAHGIN